MKKESTLRCVLTLTAIAVICGLLIAVLNPLLAVPPTVDEITGVLNVQGDYTSTVLETDKEVAKQVKGGKVELVAEIVTADATYVAMKVKTNSDGQLGECFYAMLINKSTNKIEQAAYITDGSTAGRNYATYGDKDGNGGGTSFNEYLIEITSANAFDAYTYPQTGATKTLKAVNRAFIITANYYYNVFMVQGGNA